MDFENVCKNGSYRVLIVDDEYSIRDILKAVIDPMGYEVMTSESGHEAIEILKETSVDLLIVDIHMPDINGITLTTMVKAKYDTEVIIMTGDSTNYSYEKIIDSGASDFMLKPFSPKEVKARIRRVLRERCLFKEHLDTIEELNVSYKMLTHSTRELHGTIQNLQNLHQELKESYKDTIRRLAIASEYKDENTGDHIFRISEFSKLIAKEYGLAKDHIRQIEYASPMHDVGKIGIPDSILLKPGKLTTEEFEILKSHTLIGAKILDGSKSDILQVAHLIALTHHEKWDGTGYPNRLNGEDIPIEGRILAISDVFDALTSERPYKDAYPVQIAVEIICKDRGKHFDPSIVDIFLKNVDAFIEIKSRFSSVFNLDYSTFRWSERDKIDYGNIQISSDAKTAV